MLQTDKNRMAVRDKTFAREIFYHSSSRNVLISFQKNESSVSHISNDVAEEREKRRKLFFAKYFVARLYIRLLNMNAVFRLGSITKMHVDTSANLPGFFVPIHPFRQLMKARAAFNSALRFVFNVCADCNQLPMRMSDIQRRGMYVTQRNESLKSSRSLGFAPPRDSIGNTDGE